MRVSFALHYSEVMLTAHVNELNCLVVRVVVVLTLVLAVMTRAGGATA